MSDTSASSPEERRNILVLTSIFLALALSAMDSTIVVTLLPDVIHDTHLGSLYPWLASAFIVASALITPVAGKAADRIGPRRVMLTALLVFLASSGLVAAAPNGAVLTIGRVVQGLGAGALTVMAYLLAGAMYQEQERARLQSALTAVWGVSAIGGPVLGTLFVETVGWRWAFALNIPLSLVAMVVITFGLRTEPVEPASERVDWPAMALFSLVLTAVLALLLAPSLPVATMVWAAVAVVLVAAVLVQARYVRAHPERSVVPLDLVRPGQMRAAVFIALGASITLHGSLTLLPLAADQLGLGSVVGGGSVMAGAVGLITGSIGCASVMRRRGYRGTGLLGAVAMVAGSLLLVVGAMRLATTALFAVGEGMIGAASGLWLGMTIVLIQDLAPAARLGAYTSAVSLLRSGGGAIGVNVLASAQLLTVRYFSGHAATRLSFEVAFAVQLALVVLAGLVALRLPRTPASSEQDRKGEDTDRISAGSPSEI